MIATDTRRWCGFASPCQAYSTHQEEVLSGTAEASGRLGSTQLFSLSGSSYAGGSGWIFVVIFL